MPPIRAAAAKCWCFTLNNYSDVDYERIKVIDCEYLVCGKEVGENGTPHLQGFIKFKSRKRMQQVKSAIGSNPHVEKAIDVGAASEYCKKENNFFEKGSLDAERRRTDIEAFKDTVKEGTLSLHQIREEHSEVYAKYPRFCVEYINDHYPEKPIESHPLRRWQVLLNGMLNGPVNDREVIFVVDVVGNTGKTWFAHYYRSLHDHVQVMLPGKKADMAYCLLQDSRVIFMDAPRSKQGEFIQYDFLEEMKNGYVFSGKYESMHKKLAGAHVVVLMNEQPDMSKLSRDRYRIIVVDSSNNYYDEAYRCEPFEFS